MCLHHHRASCPASCCSVACCTAQDLLPWAGRGISKEDVLQSIKLHTSTYSEHVAHPGASIAFRGGQAYASSPIDLSVLLPHQRHNLVVYLQAIQVRGVATTG
jgi:hypothetical protein